MHQVSDGSFRTTCQCMSAIFNFARRQEPCCKHAAEAVKIVNWELKALGNLQGQAIRLIWRILRDLDSGICAGSDQNGQPRT